MKKQIERTNSFKCGFCNRDFKNKAAFKTHVKYRHHHPVDAEFIEAGTAENTELTDHGKLLELQSGLKDKHKTICDQIAMLHQLDSQAKKLETQIHAIEIALETFTE